MTDKIESADVEMNFSLHVECPYCGGYSNIVDQDDDGEITRPIFTNKWDDIYGIIVFCDNCDKEIKLNKVIY